MVSWWSPRVRWSPGRVSWLCPGCLLGRRGDLSLFGDLRWQKLVAARTEPLMRPFAEPITVQNPSSSPYRILRSSSKDANPKLCKPL